MCGVVGIASNKPVVVELRTATHKLQHRSHNCAGAVTFEHERALPHVVRGLGRLTEVFTQEKLDTLRGNIGLAHVRWPTAGEPSLENVHPLAGSFQGNPFFVIHNGEISSRESLEKRFSAYQPGVTSDTKYFLALMEDSGAERFIDALQYALSEIQGTYSLIVLHENSLYAVRDVTGNRPMYVGTKDGMVAVVSESVAFHALGISLEDMREINPGELLHVDGEGLKITSLSIMNAPSNITRMLKGCLVEYLYCMHPGSILTGRTIMKVRERAGWQLAQTFEPPADIVVGVPDSGIHAAAGFAEGSGLPLVQAIIRYHQSGRLFYYGLDQRDDYYRLKYDPIVQELRGRSIVLVDDTMFASSTIQNIVGVCMKAGVKEIHIAIPAPMIVRPCFYGTPTSAEHRRLIARDHNSDSEAILGEIAAASNGVVKSLAFLPVHELTRAVVETPPMIRGYDDLRQENFCTGCFAGGKQHIPIDIAVA